MCSQAIGILRIIDFYKKQCYYFKELCPQWTSDHTQQHTPTVKKVNSTFARIIKTYAPFKWKILANIILTFLAFGFFIAIPFFVGQLINELADDPQINQVSLWCGLLGVCYLGTVIFDRIKWMWEVKYLDCQLSDLLANLSIEHMQKLSIGQHRNQHSLATMTKLAEGENALRAFFSCLFDQILPTVVGILVALAAIAFMYPVAGLVSFVFAIFIVVHGIWLGKKFTEPMKKVATFRKEVMAQSGKELIQSMGSLQITGEQKRYSNKHLRHRIYRKRQHEKLMTGLGTSFIPCQVLSAVGRILTIVTVAHLIFKGQYEVGALAAVIVWTNQSLGMLQSTQYLFRSLSEQWANIVQYFNIMDTVTAVPEADHPIHLSKIDGHIVFENVSFTYPGTTDVLLSDISLEITPGQKIGIVGPSGAGKSTLLSLLQLAYLPDLGSIRIDGINLINVHHQSYRACTGFIEQNPLILSRSLKENLMFGLSQGQRDSLTDADIEKVLKSVDLGKMMSRLKTSVGEVGNKLSGGQKQRVAIARMLLKGPDIIFVDEATSAVDPTTEKLIHRALDLVSPGATRVFIAHRLSTVQNSDVIFVMDKGKIVAKGTHSELLMSSKLYARLVKDLFLKV